MEHSHMPHGALPLLRFKIYAFTITILFLSLLPTSTHCEYYMGYKGYVPTYYYSSGSANLTGSSNNNINPIRNRCLDEGYCDDEEVTTTSSDLECNDHDHSSSPRVSNDNSYEEHHCRSNRNDVTANKVGKRMKKMRLWGFTFHG